MKRCPECDSVFSDADQFCELDGTLLLIDSSDDDPVATPLAEPKVVVALGETAQQSETSYKTLAIIAVAGVVLGVVLFFAYRGITRQNASTGSHEPAANVPVAQQRSPNLSLAPLPVAEVSPSVGPSPSQSVSPEPAKPADSVPADLSSNPISTAGAAKTRHGAVTIRLTDGTSVEADEAWETSEGIWYRRRGIVSLLDRKQVKAIEKAAAAASPAQPQSSPSQSPPP